MRANVYQARSLIGSDNSGLSDPFARIIIGEHCRSTQVNYPILLRELLSENTVDQPR